MSIWFTENNSKLLTQIGQIRTGNHSDRKLQADRASFALILTWRTNQCWKREYNFGNFIYLIFHLTWCHDVEGLQSNRHVRSRPHVRTILGQALSITIVMGIHIRMLLLIFC